MSEQKTSEPKSVKCLPSDRRKLLAIDWGSKKVLRLYYPTGVGSYYYDEVIYDGSLFITRSGIADDVRLEHGYVKWEQKYQPTDYAVSKFIKAFNDPWWSAFEEVWRVVNSLCPVTIP